MQKINYTMTISNLPSEMVESLRSAKHAGEAESVYEKFKDTCFVPKSERAQLWMQA